MHNERLFKELDRFNKRRARRLNKAILEELSHIPPTKHNPKDPKRDEIIAYNLSMSLTWGDIKI